MQAQINIILRTFVIDGNYFTVLDRKAGLQSSSRWLSRNLLIYLPNFKACKRLFVLTNSYWTELN